MFRKAERKQAKLRLALCAPSGAGKTYSALLIAKGIGGKVALLDTENGSGDLYANLFDYDIVAIKDSFEVEKYIKIIKGAEAAGYTTLIIDSLSHAWNSEGGILDQVGRAEKNKRNSFTAWKDVTPIQNLLISTILQSSMHIICTMRTKTAYEMQENSKGKMTPTKVGLAPVQRADLDYEFTVVLDISNDGHIAYSSKDRTGLYDGKNFIIKEETGRELLVWLNDGTSNETLAKRKLESDKLVCENCVLSIKLSGSSEELRRNFADGYKKLRDTVFESELVDAKDEMKAKLERRDPRIIELKKAIALIDGEKTLESLALVSKETCVKFKGDDEALAEISAAIDRKKESMVLGGRDIEDEVKAAELEDAEAGRAFNE